MLALSNILTRLREKLQRREYRHAYLAEHVRCGIAYQIRALRNQRGWKQGELSKRLDKPQSVVCRLEDPSYGKVTVHTLLEIANVFDVALEVRFVTYSSFVLKTRDVSSSAMQVLSFDDDVGAKVEVYPVKRSEYHWANEENINLMTLPANQPVILDVFSRQISAATPFLRYAEPAPNSTASIQSAPAIQDTTAVINASWSTWRTINDAIQLSPGDTSNAAPVITKISTEAPARQASIYSQISSL